MEIPLKYKLTTEILNLISEIEAKKAILENANIHPQLISNLQRQSLLKSSLFSAKIEGNSLNVQSVEELRRIDVKSKERVEIENILLALSFLNKEMKKDIDSKFILYLHEIVMKELTESPGSFRKEPSAIFNQEGFAVYIPPSPLEVKRLAEKLIEYINLKDKENVLIKACLTHLSFEKIHPFLDGNGRVGRLLFQAILIKNDYFLNRFFPLEELLNERKEEYYLYLDKNDATSFIEFILELILIQLKKTLDFISKKELKPEDLLLPRRREILEIIRDHKIITLDFLKRRFQNVTDRTLRYDLKQLEKEGLIKKLGITRGAHYAEAI
jgi:Fic family protein